MKSRMLLSFAVLAISIFNLHPAESQTAPKRIEITAKKFDFTPSEITLKKGEPVVLVLHSVDVPHGLRFQELGLDMKANKGKSSEVPFTPTKTGDFIGKCSVFCGSGHGRMKLTLHVTE